MFTHRSRKLPFPIIPISVTTTLLLALSVAGCALRSPEDKIVDRAIRRLSKTTGSDWDTIHQVHRQVRALSETNSLPRLAQWLASRTDTKRRSAIHIIQHLH